MYSYTIYIKESWFMLMVNIKIVESRLHFSVFNLIFYFLFLEQLELGLEVISHTVTSVTIW